MTPGEDLFNPPVAYDGVYLKTAVTVGSGCNTCKIENGADITFTMNVNKLASITVASKSSSNKDLNGIYQAPTE